MKEKWHCPAPNLKRAFREKDKFSAKHHQSKDEKPKTFEQDHLVYKGWHRPAPKIRPVFRTKATDRKVRVKRPRLAPKRERLKQLESQRGKHTPALTLTPGGYTEQKVHTKLEKRREREIKYLQASLGDRPRKSRGSAKESFNRSHRKDKGDESRSR